MSPDFHSPTWPFSITLPCEPGGLHELRRALNEWLQTSGIPDETSAAVVLATHEAAANAIEHSGTSSGFTTHARINDACILVEVRDQGRWKQPALQTERGRGLTLISRLMHENEVDCNGTGTTIRMTHRIDDSNIHTTPCLTRKCQASLSLFRSSGTGGKGEFGSSGPPPEMSGSPRSARKPRSAISHDDPLAAGAARAGGRNCYRWGRAPLRHAGVTFA